MAKAKKKSQLFENPIGKWERAAKIEPFAPPK